MTTHWMCTYFKTETAVAQNLIDDFFLTLTARWLFHRNDFKWKNMGVQGQFLKKIKAMHGELNERAETATSCYFATGKFLQ